MGELAPEQPDLGNEETAEEAPAWQGPSQEEWQATQQALQQLVPLAEQYREWSSAPQQEGEGDGDYEFDPLDPQALQQQIERLVDARMAPVSQYTQQQQMQEAEERARDIIQDFATREGDFLFPDQSPQMARALANDLIHDAQKQYGFTPKAAEVALHEAYKQVRAWEDAVGKKYHEQQMNQLTSLGQARREPAAAGNAAAGQLVTPEGGDEVSLARSFFAGRP